MHLLLCSYQFELCFNLHTMAALTEASAASALASKMSEDLEEMDEVQEPATDRPCVVRAQHDGSLRPHQRDEHDVGFFYYPGTADVS